MTASMKIAVDAMGGDDAPRAIVEGAYAAAVEDGASILLVGQLVAEGRAQAIVSAGNNGAVMAAAMRHLGTIPGVDRPALAAVLPNRTGSTVLLDVGANVVTKPHH